jgi:hypothetical protein
MRILDSQGTGLLGFHSGTEISLDTVEVSGTKPNGMQQLGDGIVMLEGAQLLASRSYVARNTRVGVFAHGLGSSVSLDETWITETQIGADGLMGDGVRAWSGGGVTVSRSLVSRNHSSGMAAIGPSSTLMVSQSQTSENLADETGMFGMGLLAQAGGSLSADRVRAWRNHDRGALVAQPSSSLSLHESWVSETLAPDPEHATGVQAVLGGSLSVSRSVVSNNQGVAVGIFDSNSSASISGVWLTGMPTSVAGIDNVALMVESAGTATLSGSMVSDCHTMGVMVDGEESSLLVEDSWVRDHRPGLSGGGGQGLQASQGAQLTVNRTAVSGNQSAGLLAGQLGSRIVANEVWIFGNLPNAAGLGGFGLQANMGSEIELTRSVVEGNAEGGVLALDPWTTLRIEESWVAGSVSSLQEEGGYGIGLSLGASLNLRGALLSGNHQQGLLVDSVGTVAVASELSVSASSAFSDEQSGYGVVAQEGARLELSGAHIADCFGAGAQFFWAEGSVSRSLFERIDLGEQGTADGLLATESQVEIQGVVSRLNTRAGVLLNKSGGEVSGCLVAENSIGVVNQGLPGVTVTDDNVIEANDQDRIDDQQLQVPDEPVPLPTFGESS